MLEQSQDLTSDVRGYFEDILKELNADIEKEENADHQG